MASPYIGEIRLFSYNFPPKGWAFCNGQLLTYAQHQALFSLIGTTFGGNGQTTFALPDYRGRVPMHFGNGHNLGERAGQESHILTYGQMPVHSHALTAIEGGTPATNVSNPAGNSFSNSKPGNLYQNTPGSFVALSQTTVTNNGGGQPHMNMQPFLTLNFCIAMSGIFPSRN
jgi:microcystin-dependent protein